MGMFNLSLLHEKNIRIIWYIHVSWIIIWHTRQKALSLWAEAEHIISIHIILVVYGPQRISTLTQAIWSVFSV